MKIKMSEYYQGSNVTAVLIRTGDTVNILTPDEIYEVDAVMGAWLVDNHKGVDMAEKKSRYYGAQAEPEVRKDDQIYPAVDDEPIMTTKASRKQGKAAK